MFFHIPHNIFKVFPMRTDDHVDVASHYAPAINFEAFVGLAMFPAVKHYFPVFVTDEQVDPVND